MYEAVGWLHVKPIRFARWDEKSGTIRRYNSGDQLRLSEVIGMLGASLSLDGRPPKPFIERTSNNRSTLSWAQT